jgi:hypothetical protein
MSESIIKLATGIILIIATLFGGTGSSTDNYETIVYKTDKKYLPPPSVNKSEYLTGHVKGVKLAQSNIEGNEFPVGPSCRFITD